ncbi:hypothetical protein M422DRAFT_53825 [Sphaerobolus stellatus SS14]|uniref:Uncharacterized protein n=1 Tax=Sphaerobolus stellatus (strain SS14) TaxID=990650 RepID=A0A0C9UN30_SPHS4|nr:hypothetical protein M422DRAFT_53825 [Sphaerobolus stellatus SS14]
MVSAIMKTGVSEEFVRNMHDSLSDTAAPSKLLRESKALEYWYSHKIALANYYKQYSIDGMNVVVLFAAIACYISPSGDGEKRGRRWPSETRLEGKPGLPFSTARTSLLGTLWRVATIRPTVTVPPANYSVYKIYQCHYSRRIPFGIKLWLLSDKIGVPQACGNGLRYSKNIVRTVSGSHILRATAYGVLKSRVMRDIRMKRLCNALDAHRLCDPGTVHESIFFAGDSLVTFNARQSDLLVYNEAI